MVHRNLKPENVFADGEYQPYLVKVSDCGIRNWYRVEEDGQDPEVIPIGDEAYIAPEVLAQKGFSPQMDAWSVGMLAYHMLVGRSPYPTGQRQPIDFSASELRTVSELGISFLRGLLETEEKKRLSVGNALEHAWIVEGDRLSSRPVGALAYHSPRNGRGSSKCGPNGGLSCVCCHNLCASPLKHHTAEKYFKCDGCI